MRIGVVLTGVVTVLLLTIGVVWLVRDRPLEANLEPIKNDPAVGFDIPDKGPFPKASVDQTEFNFGRIEVGDTGSFDFTIRNDGEVPLKIKKGPTTCQCTVSDVDKDEVAPGASAKVTLTWSPTTPAEMFDKGAQIHTNDPDYQTIRLKIIGTVVTRFMVYPEHVWEMRDLKEGEPATFVGKVVSTMDKEFEITGFECESPLVSAEAKPMDEEKLQEARALSGYDVVVTLQPKMPVGAFAMPLKIKTSIKNKKTDEPIDADVTVTAHRRGPIRLIGREWVEDRAAIVLSSFDAEIGKKVELSILVKDGPEGGMVFSDITADPPALQVKVERDEKFTGSLARYKLSVEYPAGSLRVSRREENPASIKLKTNHPDAPEMEFNVYLTAY